MPGIEYIEKGRDELDVIQPLWEKLNHHHEALSRYHKDHFAAFSFAVRKEQLLKKSQAGELYLILAKDTEIEKYIGYCVSSLNPDRQGEIESIYVDKEYRGQGIGDRLMVSALEWLESASAARKILGVAEGNEVAFGFYSRYNFYPRMTILEQKPPEYP